MANVETLQAELANLVENDEFFKQLHGIHKEPNPAVKELKYMLFTIQQLRGNLDGEIVAQLGLEASIQQAIALHRIGDLLDLLATPERERQEIERRRSEGLAATMEASKRYAAKQQESEREN